MNWLLSIAAFLPPCCAGFRLISAATRGMPARKPEQLLRMCLALGIGIGLSSCTWFVWLVLFGTPHAMYRIVDATFWLLIVLVCRNAPESRRGEAAAAPCESSRLTFAVACLFALVLASGAAGFAGETLMNPEGGWDAWAIWNLRAKCLAAVGDDWREAVSPEFDHGDYPLLVPATLARWWSGAGLVEPSQSAAMLALTFTLLCIALCILAVARERGWTAGLLAGMVLLGTVRLVRWGAAQYADVPLAFFFLATTLLLVLYERESAEGRRAGLGTLFLAGLTSGLCAWTKNEGLLFAVLVICVRPFTVWWKHGARPAVQEGLSLLAGAASVLAVVFLFKSQVSANDLIAGQEAGILPKLLDPARHLLILKSLAANLAQVTHGFVAVLPICFWLLGRRRSGANLSGFPALLVVLMLAGYYGVYLLTPHDLAWHLTTSADRLLVQLWPTAVLAIFLELRSPEEALAEEEAGSTLEFTDHQRSSRARRKPRARAA